MSIRLPRHAYRAAHIHPVLQEARSGGATIEKGGQPRLRMHKRTRTAARARTIAHANLRRARRRRRSSWISRPCDHARPATEQHPSADSQTGACTGWRLRAPVRRIRISVREEPEA